MAFRNSGLPKEIVKTEIETLKKLGVDFQPLTVIGFSDTIDELLASNMMLFYCSGCRTPLLP
jgi:NADPH-dependent glutamate synthase beta subunit-like oxidoreductase